MSDSSSNVADTVASVVVGAVTGVVLVGMAAVGYVMNRRQLARDEEEEDARLLVEAMLNDRAGVVLGNSGRSFRYRDAVLPDSDEDDTDLGDAWAELP